MFKQHNVGNLSGGRAAPILMSDVSVRCLGAVAVPADGEGFVCPPTRENGHTTGGPGASVTATNLARCGHGTLGRTHDVLRRSGDTGLPD